MATDHEGPRTHDQALQAYDDEIDLREYLDILILWWREIVLLSILSAVGATLAVVALRFIQQPTYEASSTVVIAGLVSEVTLDERFRTLSDDTGAGDSFTISPAKRTSLVGLVKNSAVAEATIKELGSLLDEDEQNPSRLMEAIEAETVAGPDKRSQSDLIRITASANDPDKARSIVNSWASHYVEKVNQIYNRIPGTMIDSIANEVELANESYAEAQQDLEVFVAENKISQLNRDIQEKQTIVDDLQTNKLAIIKTQLSLQQSDQELRFDLFNRLHDAEVASTVAVFDEQLARNLNELSRLNEERKRSQQYLARSEVLQEQIQAGGDASVATNALAIELLKAQLYTSFDSISLDLSSSTSAATDAETPSTTSATGQEKDIASLITALKAYIGRLDEDIAASSDTLLNGTELAYLDQITVDGLTLPGLLAETQLNTAQESTDTGPLSEAISNSYASMFSINNLADLSQNEELLATTAKFTDEIMKFEQEIHTFNAALEAEKSRQQQLVQRRDLAWSAYDTLSKKLTELSLERIAINSVVRMGAQAPTPTRPIPTASLKMVIPLAAMVGMMAAIFMAFLATYLGYKPFLSQWRGEEA